MVKLRAVAALGVGAGASIISANGAARQREPARLVAPTTVSGHVTLLGPDARPSREVGDAIVYLELVAPPPRPVAVAPAPTPAPTPPPLAAAAPRDTVSALWEMMRELRQTVAELRDAVRQLRVQLAGGPAATLPAGVLVDSAPAVSVPATTPRPAPIESVAPAALPAPRAIRSTVMAMRQKTFEPHVRVVEVGGLVEFPNRDPFSHNVFSTTSGGAFDLGLYSRGESRGVTFRRAGTYAIYCNIHSKMSAFVVAVPSALHAQVRPDGAFSIDGVPAGRYRVHAWHERAPEQVTTITVGERPLPDVQVTLDARSFRPTAHLNKFGQPYSMVTRDAY
ncbi:hypothetical protein J421_3659 [Gemmatirosa kalamazoonensis]|uniref:Blue (Type 1) copper domain protein n=1 Tax=Gemmatirosa kalamazoonensis TaxID=861299 RepID=W0RKC2_9BACT|nr:hypothetical protein J421_3659 [Gemmatirosa kalamazoonensis]